MTPRLPLLAALLGAAGLLPFLGTGYVSLSTPDPRATQALIALIAYGAVILAFLGGVQWGFVLQPTAAQQSQDVADGASGRVASLRLALGVAPALIGWVALLASTALPSEAALAILLAGFLATVGFEQHARRRGLMPPGYMVLRWVLTVVVVAVLTTVMVLRLIGAHIIF
jgi:hypothetical protein